MIKDVHHRYPFEGIGFKHPIDQVSPRSRYDFLVKRLLSSLLDVSHNLKIVECLEWWFPAQHKIQHSPA